MIIFMKVNLIIIVNMDMDMNNFHQNLYIQDNMLMEDLKVKENLHGLMVNIMMVNGLMVINMVKEHG